MPLNNFPFQWWALIAALNLKIKGGDTRAKNKTKTVLDTIDEAISILDLQIQNATDVQESNRHKLAKQRSLQLRAGFEAIDRAYARLGSGGRTTTPEIEAEQDKRIQRALKK